MFNKPNRALTACFYTLSVSLLLTACFAKEKEKVLTEETAEPKLPYYNSPDFKPYWINDAGELKKTIQHQLGKFSFTNQHNQLITEQAVKGKIHVADFFFTSCGSICPLMSNQFERLQASFLNDEKVTLLSFSVDPRNDTLESLQNYASQHHAKTGKWHLLTGNKKELYTLARTFYFAEKEEGLNKNPDQFLHTENFILVDEQGYIRGIYNGTLPEETNRLTKDIYKLEREVRSLVQ